MFRAQDYRFQQWHGSVGKIGNAGHHTGFPQRRCVSCPDSPSAHYFSSLGTIFVDSGSYFFVDSSTHAHSQALYLLMHPRFTIIPLFLLAAVNIPHAERCQTNRFPRTTMKVGNNVLEIICQVDVACKGDKKHQQTTAEPLLVPPSTAARATH